MEKKNTHYKLFFSWLLLYFPKSDSTIDITSADDSAKEDSGILVSPVSDSRPDEPDFLLFLDPRTMIEMARANFLTGQKIPFVSHGCLIKN